MADTSTIRAELHALVDCIPDGDVPATRKILRALADPAPDVPFEQIRRVRA